MNSDTFCRAWNRVNLSPEADERIRRAIASAASKPVPLKQAKKLSKIALAAILAVLLLIVTAAAVVVHRTELDLTEWHSTTLDIDSYNVTLTPVDTSGELGFWYPKELPDGYTVLFVSNNTGRLRLFFQNETGDTLELFCCTSEDYALGSVTGGYDKQDITVNGAAGYRFDATRPEELGLTTHVMLCWSASEQNAAFRLEYKGNSPLAPDLLAIAESVSLQEKPLIPTEYTFLETFGDWQPTQLPEGYAYRETSATFHTRTLSVRLYRFYDIPTSEASFSYYYTPVPDGQDAAQTLKEYALESLQTCEPVTVGTCPGYYADDSTQLSTRQLFWLNEDSGLIFALHSRYLSREELFTLAESIAKP